MPKVSIITPVYNGRDEQFERSRESIENQTSKDFEWIIVDDGSSKLSHYVSIALGNNYGPSVARNVGFQVSSGDIITYLDMGDELAPNRVENIINTFSNYRTEILFSGYIIVQENQISVFHHFDFIGKLSRYPTAMEYVRLLQYQNISTPLGVAHTRRPFVAVGGFQRGIVCGEDGILWRRMCDYLADQGEFSKVVFSDDVAGTYYVERDSQARTQRRFEMGGFAIDGSKNDNGRYLDSDWYKNFSSEGYYE